ncbi:MAG: NAD+ synthase [Pyrodictiaceae archaeon]
MGRITLNHVIDLDYDVIADKISYFIRKSVDEAGASGVVVGVSGGVDSATTLALAVKALGPSRVLAVVMPDTRTTPEEDVKDALTLINKLGVEYRLVTIDSIVDSFAELPGFSPTDHKAVGNIRARVRMIILYYYANHENRLVLGTSDRSEFLIGYFTKYGDGAADIYPISVLYKTQVRRLARHLGVPENIANKPSSPRLWPGHMAEKELGIEYTIIDLVLFSIFDLKLSIEKTCKVTGIDCHIVKRVIELHENTRHKRRCFPAPLLEETVMPAWRGINEAKRLI